MQGGIYIHVPFCRNKCLYCDFYTGGIRIAKWDEFISALLEELDRRKVEVKFIPATLYIGGGTPSLMPSRHLRFLTDNLKSILTKNDFDEFTLEVNPEDVTERNLQEWKNIGINRISMGVQSLNDVELKAIGRKHDAAQARTAMKMINEYFDNFSVDVMFGIPHQTYSSYGDTLKELIDYNPSHISCYSLMLEPGTAMTLLAAKGDIILPEEKEWIRMFDHTSEFLINRGYLRYEISNYSLPGKASRHNLSYWEGKPYIGLGPGAHSYDGMRTRSYNPNDLKGYIKEFNRENRKWAETTPDIFNKKETLSDQELIEEHIMTRLRMTKGIDLTEFSEKFGSVVTEKLLQNSDPFKKRGEMKEDSGKLCFTDKGFLVSDAIMPYLF